jgi:Uma2 family endonuclease
MLKTKPRPATYADIEALPPNMVGEIISGVLHAHPRPVFEHGVVALELAGEIRDPFGRGKGGPGGWIFASEPEIHLDAHIVVPDLAGWRKERLAPVRSKKYVDVAPDWLCEILSPSTEKVDRTEKLPVYAEYGVRHCWYLNPTIRSLEVLALSAGKWMVMGIFKDSDLVCAPPFEAHSFALDTLWVETAFTG